LVAVGGALFFSRRSKRRAGVNANGDFVTGVANRRAFIARLNAEWQGARDEHGVFGLLVVDVDSFGDINHLYGRATGDRVLAEVAERIRLRVRRDDFVARVDADEFAVICHGTAPEHLEAVRRNLEAYVNFADCVPVTLSIGYAAPSDWDESALDMLDRARESLAQRREAMPERVVEDALAQLLLQR
jgi:diguanylate cyclase (GGDEF)-like protein